MNNRVATSAFVSDRLTPEPRPHEPRSLPHEPNPGSLQPSCAAAIAPGRARVAMRRPQVGELVADGLASAQLATSRGITERPAESHLEQMR